jgi:hypothetical protein
MPRLRTLGATLAVISSAVVIWTAVAHSQSQVPGLPSPGAAPVLVVNDPTVRAVQSGPSRSTHVEGSHAVRPACTSTVSETGMRGISRRPLK